MATAKHITVDEAQAIRALAERIETRADEVSRKVDYLCAEFALQVVETESEPGSEEESEAFFERTSRMTDEHLIWSFLATSNLIHGALNPGPARGCMRQLKNIYLQTVARWAPVDAIRTGFLMYEGEEEIGDLAYLDEANEDA